MTFGWRNRPERGSAWMKRLLIWLALHAGRGFSRLLLVPICIYYMLSAPEALRASQNFLRRALGRPATLGESFRHLMSFATTLLDRVYLLHGRHRDLEVKLTNDGAFEEAIAAGPGCLLLGSHLGSFEMLGVIGGIERGLTVNMVMHLEDSAGLRQLIAATGLTPPYNVIPLGHPESMLRVKECLERGEVVGILADRVYGPERTEVIDFLGAPVRFSQSPFRLARITGVPVVAVFGLFHGGRRYEITFESIDGTHPGPYVALLERQALRTPYNWYNFYDYWEEEA